MNRALGSDKNGDETNKSKSGLNFPVRSSALWTEEKISYFSFTLCRHTSLTDNTDSVAQTDFAKIKFFLSFVNATE